MGPGDEESTTDGELGHRPDHVRNPNESNQYGNHPNQDLIDLPSRVEDPTSLDWMD